MLRSEESSNVASVDDGELFRPFEAKMRILGFESLRVFMNNDKVV